MATVNYQDVVATQLEVVSRQLEELHGTSTYIYSMVEAASEDVKVSDYLYRIVLETRRAGISGKVNVSDGGAYPLGSGAAYIYMQAGWHQYARTIRFSDLQRDTTQGGEQSIINYVNREIARAMAGVQLDNDVYFHTDGSGILTGGATTPTPTGAGTSTATLVFNGSTDMLKLNRIQGCEGMAVEVWSPDGATKRTPASTSVPTYITAIDYSTKTVTLSQTVTVNPSTSAGDVLAVNGLAAYGPSTLVGNSSTWPSRGGQTGLGGDSWMHGIYYVNDVTTSNYYLGKLKSTYPQLQSNRVDAGSSVLNFTFGRLVQDQILARFGERPEGAIVGLAHSAQMKAAEDLTIALSVNPLNGAQFTKPLDLGTQTKFGQGIPYCGTLLFNDLRQYADRIDYINKSTWFRPNLFPTKFLEGGDGPSQYMFRGRDGTTGAVMPYFETIIRQAFDFGCRAPGRAGYINSLAVPAGYGF